MIRSEKRRKLNVLARVDPSAQTSCAATVGHTCRGNDVIVTDFTWSSNSRDHPMLGDACIRSKVLGEGSGKLDSSIFRRGNWKLSE